MNEKASHSTNGHFFKKIFQIQSFKLKMPCEANLCLQITRLFITMNVEHLDTQYCLQAPGRKSEV